MEAWPRARLHVRLRLGCRQNDIGPVALALGCFLLFVRSPHARSSANLCHCLFNLTLGMRNLWQGVQRQSIDSAIGLHSLKCFGKGQLATRAWRCDVSKTSLSRYITLYFGGKRASPCQLLSRPPPRRRNYVQGTSRCPDCLGRV